MLDIKAIAFDFDGVIIESVDIKTEAFKELFFEYPTYLDKIIQYHLENGGISRYLKFKFIHEEIIKKPYNTAIGDELNAKFKNSIFSKICTCPFVEGVIEFLDKYHKKYPLYVISGTPDNEIEEIVQRRGLSDYFVDVFGSSQTKSKLLNTVIEKEKIQANNLLFIGDALSDYFAGLTPGVFFIGRANGPDIFPEKNTLTVINNFKDFDFL